MLCVYHTRGGTLTKPLTICEHANSFYLVWFLCLALGHSPVVPDYQDRMLRVEGEPREVRLTHHLLHAQRRIRVRRQVEHVHLRDTALSIWVCKDLYSAQGCPGCLKQC